MAESIITTEAIFQKLKKRIQEFLGGDQRNIEAKTTLQELGLEGRISPSRHHERQVSYGDGTNTTPYGWQIVLSDICKDLNVESEMQQKMKRKFAGSIKMAGEGAVTV